MQILMVYVTEMNIDVPCVFQLCLYCFLCSVYYAIQLIIQTITTNMIFQCRFMSNMSHLLIGIKRLLLSLHCVSKPTKSFLYLQGEEYLKLYIMSVYLPDCACKCVHVLHVYVCVCVKVSVCVSVYVCMFV